MCVIAEGVGSPHWLAHAARGRHFFWRLHTFQRTCPHMDCASTEMQNTICNNFSSGNHVRGARFNAYFALSWAISARQCTTEFEVSKLAIITPHMRKLLAHACETRVLRRAGRPGRTLLTQVERTGRLSFTRTVLRR